MGAGVEVSHVGPGRGHLEAKRNDFQVIGHGRDMHLVEDLDRGAGGAAERLDDGHGEPLLDAVLRGDINAPLRGSAWCGNAHCKAAHRHGAELSLLHGGTPDARATAVELAAAADAAVLDRAAAANTRFPRGFRHLDCEKRPLRITIEIRSKRGASFQKKTAEMTLAKRLLRGAQPSVQLAHRLTH